MCLQQVLHAHRALDRVGVALMELVAHWQGLPSAPATLCTPHALTFGSMSVLWGRTKVCKLNIAQTTTLLTGIINFST